MSKDVERTWVTHCQEMARATHEIADWCDDHEMLQDYKALAAQWLILAVTGPLLRQPTAVN